MRIATWNTWWRFGPADERQPLIDAALDSVAPDVVLLQETWPEQASRLAAACGLTVVDVASSPFDPPVLDTVAADHPFGNAVLARPGIAEPRGVIPLTSATDDAAPRYGVAAMVDGPGGPLVVVSTHLCHLHTAGSVRADQLDGLTRWVDELVPEGPVVLGGDLNQVPTSDEYRRAVAPQWRDLWAELHRDEAGPTMTVDNPRIAATAWMADVNPPGAPPGVRLDYLLARRRAADSPAVTSIERFGGAADGWPSDHLGLVATLSSTSQEPRR